MNLRQAARQALEALEGVADWVNTRTREHPWDQWQRVEPAMQALRTAIEQAEKQEPVAFNAGVPPLYPEMKDGETISVEYTTPPAAQRQWVEPTDEEIDDIYQGAGSNDLKRARAIGTLYKEKNA
jgi:hypothetical protein